MGVGGVESAVGKIILLSYCVAWALCRESEAQSKWRSSKENQGESILAQLTEIKRLRRALASGIMEYGKSHPAQDKPLPILQEKSAISLVPELCTTLNIVLSFFLPTFSLNFKIFSSDSLILSPVAVVRFTWVILMLWFKMRRVTSMRVRDSLQMQ